jgi:hypothetical protein
LGSNSSFFLQPICCFSFLFLSWLETHTILPIIDEWVLMRNDKMIMVFVYCTTYFNSFGAQLLFMEPHSSKNWCSVGIYVYLFICYYDPFDVFLRITL